VTTTHMFLGDRVLRWLERPVPVLRLEIVRIGAPLAILGFYSARIAHADEWLGDAGFRVPDLGRSDYRQPLYLPALPSWAAWAFCLALILSGLALAGGFRPRKAAIVFAAAAAWVALSDRLAAFSVSKLAPVVALALALSPCGARWSVDAYLQKRAHPDVVLPTEVSSGSVRFFQLLLPVIYSASGIAKMRGDWLSNPYVLWTHLHDTYQTGVTLALANALPAGAWTLFQAVTLAFEAGAPLWFSIARVRPIALVVGVGMHTMIGLMFGPVRYFAMLMATLLLGAFLPERILERILARVDAFTARARA
jgi:vitamin K-dependent gamma-carboxylase-like protein